MRLRVLTLGIALALGACGRGGNGAGAQPQASAKGGNEGGNGNEGGQDGAKHGCDGIMVRLLGTNPGDVSSIGLVLGGVVASDASDGHAIDVKDVDGGKFLDVSTDAQMFDLGKLPFADGEGPMNVTISFDRGHACKGDVDRDLDACLPVISFEVEPGRVSPDWCQVVVLLNVGRSVVPDDGGLALLPNLRVVY